MKNLSSAIAFVIGGAIGSVTTWVIVKKRYEKIAQEEIDSVKISYGKKPISDVEIEKDVLTAAENAKEKPDILEYSAILRKQGYTKEEKDMEKFEDVPYVIPPEQFGELDDYEKISLTYYLDGSLADDNDDLIEDVDEVIGLASLNHFGEYEPDSVFVRNDRLKCDYEILLDQRSYSDVLRTSPHITEV